MQSLLSPKVTEFCKLVDFVNVLGMNSVWFSFDSGNVCYLWLFRLTTFTSFSWRMITDFKEVMRGISPIVYYDTIFCMGGLLHLGTPVQVYRLWGCVVGRHAHEVNGCSYSFHRQVIAVFVCVPASLTRACSLSGERLAAWCCWMSCVDVELVSLPEKSVRECWQTSCRFY